MVSNGDHRRPVDDESTCESDRPSGRCSHKKRSATDQRLGLCYACRETSATDLDRWI